MLLYGIGSLMFIPGEYWMSFEFFLFSLFVIACGLVFLETAANPYMTVRIRTGGNDTITITSESVTNEETGKKKKILVKYELAYDVFHMEDTILCPSVYEK